MNNMNTFMIVLNLLLLYVDVSHPKPLPGSNLYPFDLNHSDSYSELTRVRRSIPEFDAVNPEYLDEDSLSREGIAGSQKDISPFSLGDQVSNFFKSNRLSTKTENSPKGPVRQVPGERAMRVAEEEDSMDDGGLRTDEQEECYKQQNIEPPRKEEVQKGLRVEKKTQKKISGANNPMTDVAFGPRTSYVRSELLKNSGKYHQPHDGEPLEVFSLYSEPEKQSNYQMRMKNYRQPKYPDQMNVHGRVYKPVEVEPQFPVYDEDIDFHPDPLQGILDDKYWLDPLEREAVIKKYIDLAANNMMSPDVEIVKRTANKENNVKKVNSNTELKDAGARCPCKDVKEVVGCNECKGKGQRNYTADDYVGVPYGRKLLSVTNEEVERLGESGISYGKSGEIGQMENDNLSFRSNHQRKVLSWEDGGVGDGEEEDDEDIEAGSYEQNVFHRRHILFYEENEESYDDDDEEESDEELNKHYPELNEQGSMYDIPKSNVQHHKVDPEPEEDDLTISKDGYHSDNGNSEPQVAEDLTKLKDNNRVFPPKNNFVDTLDKPPAYYTPNKFANFLQKPLKEKPKGPKKIKEIDPNREFEVVRNETIINATLEILNEKPSPASNSTANITNVGQAKQRVDGGRFGYEGSHLTNVRYQPKEQLDESGGYSYKDEYNASFEKKRTAPGFLEEPLAISKDNAHLSKRSGEIKRSHQNEMQNFELLKRHKYVRLDGQTEDCGGYSYKDGLNISQSHSEGNQDSVEQYVSLPQENKTLRKRWDDRRMYAHKGRRSFASIKQPPGLQLQNPDDVVAAGLNGANKTSEGLNGTIANTTSNANSTSATNMTDVPLSVGVDNTTTHQPNSTSRAPTTKKARNQEAEKQEDVVDTEIAKDIVETVISESQRSSVLGHHLGLCRRNESSGNVNYGRVVPETEKVLKSVTDCIMNRLKSHLEKQSCVLLDAELLEFLKWMVLSGESYKDYLMKLRGYHEFLPRTTAKPITCETPTEGVQTTCEAESPPPLLNEAI